MIHLLTSEGYKVLGPTVKNDVITYGQLCSTQDLPVGWKDEQKAGYYRLKKRDDNALFGYNLGPHSWKQFLFPSNEKVLQARKLDSGLTLLEEIKAEEQKMAFIAVRACELKAIEVLDKVFIENGSSYRQYKKRREELFIIAVNCTRSVSTCFCTTMKTGPTVEGSFDIAITEVIQDHEHYFTVRVGSPKGQKLCDTLHLSNAQKTQEQRALQLIEENKKAMQVRFDDSTSKDMLSKSHNYKAWDDVAARCINCANCTLVCPTCFCSDTKEKVSLDGSHSERWQHWESCFNLSHSYVHGGSIRTSSMSRYRQWLTHKFGTWWDQFDTSGCVGCGRCITWCPVGIDVTEEINNLHQESKQSG